MRRLLPALLVLIMQSVRTEPRLVGDGVISTPDDEVGFALAPDGKTAFFGKVSPTTVGEPLQMICMSRFENGGWGTPEVAPFSGQYRDFGPAMAPDGSRLFFISNRPVSADSEKHDLNIWFVQRAGNSWSDRRNIGAPVNSDANEYGVSVANDGTLYFGSSRAGGKGSFDIYRSKLVDGQYQAPENVGDSINTAGPEMQPAISPDGKILVFTALGRQDEMVGVHRNYNKGDLYVSFYKDGIWTKARNCGPLVNSGGQESWPGFSPDGKRLFFSSERGFASNRMNHRLTWRELHQGLSSILNGMGNIYEVDATVLRDAGR
jgi:Tol biopolymer transport system component